MGAKGKAQAQALAQKQEAISATESYQLVHCLIRVSVYHVCWMRGLFPEESFSGHDLSQLDKLHIKLLKPAENDEEASTVQQWVELGVMDAVQKGYLKNMYFGIAQDAEATNLLEEYIYSFKYGDSGVEFEVNTSSHKGKKKDKYNSADAKGKAPPNVDIVRYQVVRLMRMLVQVCQTLDEVPEERYLFIKLTYHDHTPEEYEPPHFHAVSEEGIGHFSRRPFSMEVGTMDTHHHTVSLRVKSVLDSCGGADELTGRDDDLQELEASQQNCGPIVEPDGDAMMADDEPAITEDPESPAPAEPAAVAGADDDGQQHRSDPKFRTEDAMRDLLGTEGQDVDMMMGTEDQQQQQQQEHNQDADGVADGDDVTHLTGEDDQNMNDQGSPFNSQEAAGEAYERVRNYCLERQEVNYVDVMACFYELNDSQLHRVFEGLEREGLLEAGPQKDTFIVMHPGREPAPAAAPPAAADGAVGSGKGSAAGSGGGISPEQQQQQQPFIGSESQDPMQDVGGDNTLVRRGAAIARLLQQDQQISQLMTGLSVGGSQVVAAGAGAAAKEAKTGLGSVLAKNVHAGSDASGGPQTAPIAPSAANTHQLDPAAAAADEPSVGLPQDQEQHVWFDASQASLVGLGKPGTHADSAAAAGHDGAAAAAAAAGSRQSRLRKASYVDKPVYQHAGKRARMAEENEQQQEPELLPGAKMQKGNPAVVQKPAAVQKAAGGGKAKVRAKGTAAANRGKRMNAMK